MRAALLIFLSLFFLLKKKKKPAHLHKSHSFRARFSPQWLSELKVLWTIVPWHTVCWWVPTLCLDSQVSLLRLHYVKSVCVFGCNLPPALCGEMAEVFYVLLQVTNGAHKPWFCNRILGGWLSSPNLKLIGDYWRASMQSIILVIKFTHLCTNVQP